MPFDADLEWKLIYVGSAEDEKYDQVLESVLVGPVNVGNYRVVFQVFNNITVLLHSFISQGFSFYFILLEILLCGERSRL
jgi:hypothetical protein